MRRAFLLFISCSLGCSPCATKPKRPDGPPGRTGTARIEGTVSFVGTPPGLPQSARGAFSECTGGPVRTESLLLSPEKRLGEVVVYVKSGLQPGDYPVPQEKVVLEQRGCEYAPRVFALRAGQPLEVRNGDPALHNVHALAGPGSDNKFNFAMPQGRAPVEVRFAEEQVPVTLTCDVHPWMRAYAAVLDHPFFAVTGRDGAFALRGLPAGSYQLEAWHERLGRFTQSVTLADGQTARADFSLR